MVVRLDAYMEDYESKREKIIEDADIEMNYDKPQGMSLGNLVKMQRVPEVCFGGWQYRTGSEGFSRDLCSA